MTHRFGWVAASVAVVTALVPQFAAAQNSGRLTAQARSAHGAAVTNRPVTPPWQRLNFTAASSASPAVGGIITIPTPGSTYAGCTTAYTSCTNLLPIAAPDFTNVSSLADGNLTVTFSAELEARTVPTNWTFWNGPPATESSTLRVLVTPGTDPTTIVLTFSKPLLTFGLEAEPDLYGVAPPITQTFFNGSTTLGSITQNVGANGGALLFAGTVTSASAPITSVSVTGAGTITDFAIGQLRYLLASPTGGPLQVTAPSPGQAGVVGVPYNFPITVTGGAGPLTYSTDSLLPPGLSLNGSTGVISGIPTQSGTFPINILVTDSQRQSTTYVSSITVSSGTRLNLTASCPAANGVQGAPYSFSVSATGGAGALTWQLVGGLLPQGLSLNAATGAISGTPTVSGTFPITVRVTDSAQGELAQTVTYTCNIVIAVPPPVITDVTITSGCPASTAFVGSPYAQTLTATGGNGSSFIFSISQGSLPAGLTLNGNRIGGTPAGPAGTTRFSIQVSSGDATTQLACSITVAPPQLQVTSACPANGTQGVPYPPFPLTATGGSGPGSYTFAIVGGPLPAGLTLAGNTISGTPQGPPGASSAFTIQVTSGTTSANSGPCAITIAAAPLAIAGTCPATAQAGVAISVPVTASGGKAPYTFAFTGSQGLSFNNGTVSGTLASAGTGAFSVTVNDAGNSPAQTLSCSFPVTAPANPLQIAGSCPSGAVPVNAPFSLPLSALGGTGGAYTWTLSGPSWLSLSSTSGVNVTLSGTPPSVGPAPFTVTLSDNAGTPVATFTCSLQVAVTLQITSAASCPASPVDFQTAVSIGLSVSGGTAPYTWAYSGPSYLKLSTTTGASTTVSGSTTASGAASFSVTVSDSANTAPVTFSCAFTVRPALVPPISLTVGSTISLTPAGIVISLNAPAPQDLSGTVTLTFKSTATNPLDNNPQVHFTSPAGTTAPFTIPKGSQSITLPPIEQGSVAGTIHVEITDLRAGTDIVLPPARVFADIVVPGLKPVITNQFPAASSAGLSFENETANGFDIVISGYSTPRDMSSATVTFAAASGATLEGDSTFTVPLSNIFTAYYQSARSTAAGSIFTGLRIPVTVSGDKSVIASVTVTLTNSAGTSDSVTKTR